jgi:hypothetical protein
MSDMKQYKVLADNLSGHKQGDTVSENDLAGANVEALIQGEHIAEIGSKTSNKQPKVEE